MSHAPLSQRNYYTTGEMARALSCAQQTIIRQIDAGRIPAYRMPGGKAKHRRAFKAAFRKFLADHGIPADGLDEMERRIALAATFRSGGNKRG